MHPMCTLHMADGVTHFSVHDAQYDLPIHSNKTWRNRRRDELSLNETLSLSLALNQTLAVSLTLTLTGCFVA